MGLHLRKVVLSNIRGHKDFEFIPAENGVTTLRGSTGAGKSSIVDSIAWVLYGVKPRNVSSNAAIMNDKTDWKDNKFFATVEIVIDGAYVLKAERRIVSKAGTTQCEVWEAPISEVDENFEFTAEHQKAGPAPTSAGAYIRQRLKMDSKGFLAAVLVQQKQVDSLITAGPAKRAGVIEKLTGISSATLALQKAREENNSVKKTLDLTNFNNEDFENAKAQLASLKNEVDELSEIVNKKEAIFVDLNEKLKTLKDELDESQSVYDYSVSKRENLISLQAQLKLVESSLAEKMTAKDFLKKEFLSLKKIDAKQVRQDYLALQSSQARISSVLANLSIDEKKLRSSLEKCFNVIADSGLKTLPETENKKSEYEKFLAESENELSEVKQEISSAINEVKKLDGALRVLTDEGGCCPTCRQTVNDLSLVLDSLNTEKEKLITFGKGLRKKESALEQKVQESASKIKTLNEISQMFSESEKLTVELDEKVSKISSLQAELDETDNKLSYMQETFAQAEIYERKQEDYRKAQNEVIAIAEKINDLQGEISAAETALKSLKVPSSTSLQKKRDSVKKADEKADKARLTLFEKRSELKVLAEQMKFAEIKVTEGEKAKHNYQELLKTVETTTSTVEIVEKFRTKRIKDSVPVIEAYASDLISRFTGGKFIAVELDQEFNANVVLADGRKRAVGLLSGGEMSATAIALRVAISMLLNGDSGDNLIILDEVLVSQDYDRSEMIIETIKSVCKGQIVLIAHNDSIDAHSDKVVEITEKTT